MKSRSVRMMRLIWVDDDGVSLDILRLIWDDDYGVSLDIMRLIWDKKTWFLKWWHGREFCSLLISVNLRRKTKVKILLFNSLH